MIMNKKWNKKKYKGKKKPCKGKNYTFAISNEGRDAVLGNMFVIFSGIY
jgi:hypothetical protein